MDIYYQLIAIAVRLLFFLRVYPEAAACTYPLSWRQVTWFHHYDDELLMYVYAYQNNGNIKQVIRGANVPGLNIYFQCRKQVDVSDQRWYAAELMLQGNPTGHIQCMHIIPDAGVLLERPTKVDLVSQCPQQENTIAGFNVMVPHPFDFSSGSCPFTSRTAHVTYNADASTTQVCSGIAGSEVTISRQGININTCNPIENDYTQPYRAQLQCVETFSGDKIDSSANGDILILARQMASTTFFYCARYKVQGDTTYMSLDVSDKQTVNCLPSVNHLTFGVKGQYLHRGFVFSDKKTTPSSTTKVSTTVTASTSTTPPTTQPSSSSQSASSSSSSSSRSPQPPSTPNQSISQPAITSTRSSTSITLNSNNTSTGGQESTSDETSGGLPQYIIIIISVFCALAILIVIIVLVSVTYCKIRNRKEEEERPPELTDESDIGPIIAALDNDNGTGVRSWYPEYRTNTNTSIAS